MTTPIRTLLPVAQSSGDLTIGFYPKAENRDHGIRSALAPTRMPWAACRRFGAGPSILASLWL